MVTTPSTRAPAVIASQRVIQKIWGTWVSRASCAASDPAGRSGLVASSNTGRGPASNSSQAKPWASQTSRVGGAYQMARPRRPLSTTTTRRPYRLRIFKA